MQLIRWAEFQNFEILPEGSVAAFFVKNKITNRTSILAWSGSSFSRKDLLETSIYPSDELLSGNLEFSKQDDTRIFPSREAGINTLKSVSILLRVTLHKNYEVFGVNWFLPSSCQIKAEGHHSLKVPGLLAIKFSSMAGHKKLDITGRAIIGQTGTIPFQYNRFTDELNSKPFMDHEALYPPNYTQLENLLRVFSERNGESFSLQLIWYQYSLPVYDRKNI
ncbi:unnamed protein product [Echinostoma caproni]|uniref:TcA_TcB_BD domain-containing protein n=1 Tax=Echinostoma caproni TaxID=27848 RepID=A0A183B9G7_9TREM|nr:unnamed protein product [Echinostoma caproni]